MANEFWSWDNWLGTDKKAGLLPVVTEGAGALMQGWAGLKGLDLAKRQLALQEQTAAANLANQANLTNERLYTRQQSRYNRDPSRFQSPDAFMKQWGVTGKLGG